MELTVQAGTVYSQFDEYDTRGKKLNTETGFMPWWEVGVAQSFQNRWYLSASYRLVNGLLDYDGQLQSGQAYRTDTSTQLTQLKAEVSYSPRSRSVLLSSLESIALYSTVEQRDRLIKGHGRTATLDEVYQWYTLGLDLKNHFDWQNLTTHFGFFRSFNGKLKVKAEPVGQGKVELPAGWGGNVGVRWPIMELFMGEMALNLEYYYHLVPRSQEGYLKKNNRQTARFREPEHSCQMLAFSLSVHW